MSTGLLPEPDPPPKTKSPPSQSSQQSSSPPSSPQLPPQVRSTASNRLSGWRYVRSLANPTIHHIPYIPLKRRKLATGEGAFTVREFDRARQRRRLFLNSSFQLSITIVLCVMSARVLLFYSGRDEISDSSRQTFNSLITVLQIGIGINVASSFRSYAKMLRWRILATCPRRLAKFDLILSCDEQTSVFRLFWLSRRERCCFIPTITQLVCLIWLLINMTSAIAIALLGLTYSFNQDLEYPRSRPGLASVLNLASLDIPAIVSRYRPLSCCAQLVGLHGSHSSEEHYHRCISLADQNDCSFWTYHPVDQTPVLDTTNSHKPLSVSSDRSLTANTTCTRYNVTADRTDTEGEIEYVRGGKAQRQHIYYLSSSRGITYIYDWSPAAFCGSRCATIYAYSPSQQVSDSLFFVCENTMQYSHYATETALPFPDSVARQIAGAIAIDNTTYSLGNGTYFASDSNVHYDQEKYIALLPLLDPSKWTVAPEDVVANAISSFALQTVASADQVGWEYPPDETIFDDTDDAYRMNSLGSQPYYPVQLAVTWGFAATLLGIVPFLQFIIVCAVIAYANKAIVMDGSNLTIAKLLIPVVEKLGDHGCLLAGHEIVDVLEDQISKVVYGHSVRRKAKNADEKDIMHVGVFEEGRGGTDRTKPVEGWYDGAGEEVATARKRRRRGIFSGPRRRVLMRIGSRRKSHSS